MTIAVPDALVAEIVAVLRGAGPDSGCCTAAGSPRADSDVDVAAWWPSDPPPTFNVLLPSRVDLVVLAGHQRPADPAGCWSAMS
jgi:hypothetical protein